MLDFSKYLGGIFVSTFDWLSYSFFFSANSTQTYLKNCYQNNQVENAEQKSYENCYPYIYYLEHGKIYYEQAKIAPIIIQPILLFYGIVHLIKACILTVDPNYPETTSVLAHGVSTRKRKKQQYHFLNDEVKFQKNGLFPFMADQLFFIKQLEGDKSTMRDLFKQVPELNTLFYQLEGKHTFAEVKQKDNEFHIPCIVLDAFHMTKDRFADYFAAKSPLQPSFDRLEDSFLVFKIKDLKRHEYTPLKYNLIEQSYSIPLTKGSELQFPELLVHYLLLYNLSMIARYETEWWSELIKTMPDKDFPFIQTFLNLTQDKGPFLVYEYLIREQTSTIP